MPAPKKDVIWEGPTAEWLSLGSFLVLSAVLSIATLLILFIIIQGTNSSYSHGPSFLCETRRSIWLGQTIIPTGLSVKIDDCSLLSLLPSLCFFLISLCKSSGQNDLSGGVSRPSSLRDLSHGHHILCPSQSRIVTVIYLWINREALARWVSWVPHFAPSWCLIAALLLPDDQEDVSYQNAKPTSLVPL